MLQHLRYRSDQLLEALQATVIYLLLQAEDPELVDVNDTLSLLDTISVRHAVHNAQITDKLTQFHTSGHCQNEPRTKRPSIQIQQPIHSEPQDMD